jgi:hypothetical protein
VAGRCTFRWPILTVLAVLAAAPNVRAVDILRLQSPADKSATISIAAKEIHTWSEGTERIHALQGNVKIQQGTTTIHANRAVVWIDAEALKKQMPVAVVVYADGNATRGCAIESEGQPRQEAEAAVVEFVTPGIASIAGGERQQSYAESDLYRSALAARGRPVPPAKNVEPKAPAKNVDSTQFVQPIPDPERKQPVEELPPAVAGKTVTPIPLQTTRTVWISPRTNRPFTVSPFATDTEKGAIVTGGIKLLAKFTTGSIRSVEIEADQVVIWYKGGDSGPVVDKMRTEQGAQDADGIELYLTGNVVMRFGIPEDKPQAGPATPQQTRTLRAERVYYDVSNHKAISISADLEYTREGYANTGHIVASEIHQLSATEFTAFEAMLHASRLPSDPRFTISVDRADVYKEPRTARRTVFGTAFRNRLTGAVVEEEPEILEIDSMTARVLDVPIFYLPSARTNLNDPFGPFEGATVRQDRIFGAQIYATWDMLDLIGYTPLENEKWNLLTDYLSLRGPAIGTNYRLSGLRLLEMDAPFDTLVKAYAIQDKGEDRLGGPREKDFVPEKPRGRFLWQHRQRFTLWEPEDLTLQSQIALLSDRNFLEQYYNAEYLFGPNQETFAWLKYQSGNFAGTFLVEPNVGRSWVSETYWLPRLDGYLLGQSLFDRLTYHTWGNIGYAHLHTYRQPVNEFPNNQDNGAPPPEHGVETGRVDWMQKISAPFDLGPARVVPYGVLDLAYYTEDYNYANRGRLYGGGGVRASVPLSKLYADVESELFNVQGLYHKNLFSVNYYVAGSTTSWLALPQLDRLNDDAVENGWRNVTPWQSNFSFMDRNNGLALQNGSYNRFNARGYAIRRLIDSKPDTLDDIQVVQLDWRQRWQTKRGYPGLEHTVDWLIWDLSASVFPAPSRDNFDATFGLIETAVLWNVGDRNAVFANAWVDPFDYGARYWEVGTTFARDDRTSFTVSYKNTDPLQSRYVAVSASYVFSPKYAITAVTAYDLGYSGSLSNTVFFTRVGADAVVSVGFTYNSIINNLGIQLNIMPNLLASSTTPLGINDRRGGPGGYGGGSGVPGR